MIPSESLILTDISGTAYSVKLQCSPRRLPRKWCTRFSETSVTKYQYTRRHATEGFNICEPIFGQNSNHAKTFKLGRCKMIPPH
jgi:hypothetical protein